MRFPKDYTEFFGFPPTILYSLVIRTSDIGFLARDGWTAYYKSVIGVNLNLPNAVLISGHMWGTAGKAKLWGTVV